MFKEALQDMVDKTDGGIAGLLMDSSGIALESYSRDDAPFDINTIGIEFSVVIGSIKRATESLEAGSTHEVAIGTDKMITLIRMLSDTYFLALAMKPEGNFGKGRYLMRTAAPKLLAELS
jgi:predicted regulator of Ras-like GTPase activity (Roadblock/LC7/MglB family)